MLLFFEVNPRDFYLVALTKYPLVKGPIGLTALQVAASRHNFKEQHRYPIGFFNTPKTKQANAVNADPLLTNKEGVLL